MSWELRSSVGSVLYKSLLLRALPDSEPIPISNRLTFNAFPEPIS